MDNELRLLELRLLEMDNEHVKAMTANYDYSRWKTSSQMTETAKDATSGLVRYRGQTQECDVPVPAGRF